LHPGVLWRIGITELASGNVWMLCGRM
jgi:hypothetical protein